MTDCRFALGALLLVAALSAAADEGGRSNVWSCEIRVPELKLTSCELRDIRHARGGKAVMLNADLGFVRNSRGFAEAAFEAPSEGWYEVTVSGCSNGRTPLEIWVNDYGKVVLPFAAARPGKFVEEAFRHRFRAGRNVLRLLGPGSALYIAVDGVKVAGPVAAPTADGASRPGPDVAALAARIDAKLAAGVTLAKDVTYLEPPPVEKPFAVRIDKVTPENEVVYYSGTVSPKKDDVTVEVTYRVTDARGNSALTKPVKVRVKGLGEARRTFVNPLGSGADPFVNHIDGWYYHIQAKHDKTCASLYLHRTRSFIDFGSSKPVKIHTFGPFADDAYTSEVWGWFPIIKWTDGHYYIFYAACKRHDNETHRMFVLKSKKPNDPLSGYEELGMVNTGGIWAIGLNYFQWKGRYYAIWSGWRRQDHVHLPQCSYLAKMENPWTIGERVEISAPTLGWEGTDDGTPIQEGAMVFEVNGKLVMLYSANASFSNRYAIGMLVYVGGDREEDLMNPANWVKQPEPFISGTDAILAPGVPGLTQSPDGKEWWLLYHVAKYDGAGWWRQIMAQVVGTDEKGLPYVRKPASYFVPMYMPSGDGFMPPERVILDARKAKLSGGATCERDDLSAYGHVVRNLRPSKGAASYRFTVSRAGRYRVIVRYACFTPGSALRFKVNGKVVAAPSCKYLGPEDSADVRAGVDLKAGENELSLSVARGGETKLDVVVVEALKGEL